MAKRSKFSLSNYKLLTMDMGELIPCGLTEVLPGDTIQQATSALVRCSPLVTPVMHPVHVRIHHWFVPHRLVWDDWEDFITGGPDGEDDSAFPTMQFGGGTGAAIGSLADYLGITPLVNNLTASALPIRGYNLIWNEWYRDQDLQDDLVISTASGADTTTSRALQNVAWEKDYFTSARPFDSKGPAITLPFAEEAPVNRVPNAGSWKVYQAGTNTGSGSQDLLASATGNQITNAGSATFYSLDPDGGLVADLTEATAISINDLREAFALQRYQEARARYGSRYIEYLRYLGVRSSDARLQRPEYLGGGKQTIQFSEVLQTAEGTNPVGEMRGHGIGLTRSNRYRRYFEEHGYVFSFISCKPKTIYAQGLFRTFNRRIKEDFWQKELQHIGQQEILYKEVYAGHATPDGTFGYQDRYDEYRRSESTIAGEFRTDALDEWHLARIFSADPALNATFVSSVPTKRVFASQATDTLYCMVNHSIQARRHVARSGTSYIY